MAEANRINWDYPHPFTLPCVPGILDIDGLNHTNNAVYVQWCEMIGWGLTVLRGRWDLVCIEIASGRPKRMPREFSEIYLPAVVKQTIEASAPCST